MKINNKFKVGETVYFMCNNRIQTRKISWIKTATDYNGTQITYELSYPATDSSYYYENSLFKTSEDLISKL